MRRVRGFTLVEVLVATAVLALGLLAALTAFSTAARVNGAARNDTTITFLAQQKLAEIRVLGREGLVGAESAGDFGSEHPGYGWELFVREPDELNVVQVDLVITSMEAGRPRETWFSTLVF
jgi:general secretion pathway protein I